MPHEAVVVVVYEVNNKDSNPISIRIQYTCRIYLIHQLVQHFDQINNMNNTNQVNRLECLQNIQIFRLNIRQLYLRHNKNRKDIYLAMVVPLFTLRFIVLYLSSSISKKKEMKFFSLSTFYFYYWIFFLFFSMFFYLVINVIIVANIASHLGHK
jgi:hypothetical protein